jgi:hypothetical protein
MFAKLGFWPRVSTYEGREIERALAGPNLLDAGIDLGGAVVEASYAAMKPSVLGRLQETDTAYAIDPQSLRFVTDSYQDVATLRKLPYAPSAPLRPGGSVEQFVVDALKFQDEARASAYVVPGTPIYGARDGWQELNAAVHWIAASKNGRDVANRPLVAYIAPDALALRNPTEILRPLSDLPLEALYFQPLRFHPTRESVERLVAYCRFVISAKELGFDVICGRVGALGLLLQTLGITAFDSGLGEAESFNLSQLNRRPKKKKVGDKGGGRNRRVYLEAVKTTLISKDVDAIFNEPSLRHRFTCSLPCCRFSGFEGLADRRRQHYLRVRLSEVENLSKVPTAAMRLEYVHQELQQAQSHAQVVKRVLEERGANVPKFEHLDAWLALTSRIAEMGVAA